MSPRFVLLANPSNRRVSLFQRALTERGLEPARIVSWLEFLESPTRLRDALSPGALLRIDSPGECFDVERALLRWGREAVPRDATVVDAPERLEPEHGRILAPAQYQTGLGRALHEVARQLRGTGAHSLNPPDEVIELFDKRRCHAILQQCGVRVPGALGEVRSYEELRARMAEAGWSRVFLKLNGGSSASGVVALATSGARVVATTSTELIELDGEVRLYNSLRVRRYEDERRIALLVDALAREGVHVERWVPKRILDGRAIDLRLLTIAGEPSHAVVRTSKGPLTNLHLGNARGDLPRLKEELGERGWSEVESVARNSAAVFSGSLHLGIDLLLPARSRPVVGEVNAFGDLLPGVQHDGRDVWAAEVDAVLAGGHARHQALRAVFFDLDNTLVDRDAALLALLFEVAREWGAEPNAMRAVFGEENRFGVRARDELCLALARRFGRGGDEARRLERRIARELPRYVAPRPGLRAALERLASRLWVGIVTDGDPALQRAKLEAAGLDGLPVLFTGELGLEKPDARVFERALSLAGCRPEESLFVGDNPERDCAGARRAGMRMCWIARGRADPGIADWRCDDVSAVLERLARWVALHPFDLLPAR